MADILIKNGTVIAIDPERRIIADGAVAITGDRIVAVGPAVEVEGAYPAGEVIDARGMAIMPGFVDAHAHAGHGLIKTLGGGKSDPWYQACRGAYTVGSTPEFWFAEAQLAALDDPSFRALFSKSPIKRIGRDRFVRNVLYAIGNSGDERLRAIVEPLLGDPDETVRDAAGWAASRLAKAQAS